QMTGFADDRAVARRRLHPLVDLVLLLPPALGKLGRSDDEEDDDPQERDHEDEDEPAQRGRGLAPVRDGPQRDDAHQGVDDPERDRDPARELQLDPRKNATGIHRAASSPERQPRPPAQSLESLSVAADPATAG